MRIRGLSILAAAAFALGLAAAPVHATPIGTAFGFQGRLLRGGIPVQGPVDIRYTLWDDVSVGVQFGAAVTQLGVAVTDGLVSTPLDFGNSFDGNQRWIQVEVKGASDAAFVLLTPRMEVLPVPYALWAGGGAGLTLPFFASQFAPGTLFEIQNNSASSTAGAIRAQTSQGIAVDALTISGNGDAIHALKLGYGNGNAIHGEGQQYVVGVYGSAQIAPGVYGLSQSLDGVRGVSNDPNWSGVRGENNTPYVTASGVTGSTSSLGNGVYGYSGGGYGVLGKTGIANKAGVKGTTDISGAYGGWFENTAQGGVAIYTSGEAQVGVLTITGGADLAERFETAEAAEPGTVLAIDPAAPGRLRVATGAYAHDVAGVVSGANELSAGVVLGRDEAGRGGQPVALSGRVWVRCDAASGAIRPGDLLTTAERAGYAMKAADRRRAGGATLGKAMSSLETGTGLVLVLVSLQ